MESADLEKAFRCVLQHEVVPLASFCAFSSASKTALRCASDLEVDTLRWRPEFQRRFPFLSSTQSRTLSVARSAQIWHGEQFRFSTCWRRTYLSCVQARLHAVRLREGTSNTMLQHYVQTGQFDKASKEVEQGGATVFGLALGLALNPADWATPERDWATPERDAARGLFVASVLASQSRPLSEGPDGGYVRGALPPAASHLHVSAVRTILTSQWFRASTVEYRRTQINQAIDLSRLAFDIDSAVRQHPQRMLLEGQPGYDQNAPWVTTLSFLRSMSDDYRENLCTLYRRATTIGEMLRGVAIQNAGDDVAGIDARLELLRIATANLEENAGYVHDGNEWVRAE